MLTVGEIRKAIEGLPDDLEVATDLTMDTCSAFHDGLSAEIVGVTRLGMSLTFDVSADSCCTNWSDKGLFDNENEEEDN